MHEVTGVNFLSLIHGAEYHLFVLDEGGKDGVNITANYIETPVKIRSGSINVDLGYGNLIHYKF